MERNSNGDIHADSNELTARAQRAYSREGGNIMSDGSSGPGPEVANSGGVPDKTQDRSTGLANIRLQHQSFLNGDEIAKAEL